RIEAVLAEPRQIHHEGVFELAVDILLHALEIHVLRTLLELTAENLLPVRPPLDLLDPLATDGRARTRSREGLGFLRGVQVLIGERERLVITVDFRQVRICENVGEDAPFGAYLRFDAAVLAARPAAIPLRLILPLAGVTDAGLGFDIVEPGVFDA